jgi:hypothetical protein
MKIQIDTINQTIKIENDIEIGKFMNSIKKLLPNNEWKNYKLISEEITVWSDQLTVGDIPEKGITYLAPPATGVYSINFEWR